MEIAGRHRRRHEGAPEREGAEVFSASVVEVSLQDKLTAAADAFTRDLFAALSKATVADLAELHTPRAIHVAAVDGAVRAARKARAPKPAPEPKPKRVRSALVRIPSVLTGAPLVGHDEEE
jgi:hypothetical protein